MNKGFTLLLTVVATTLVCCAVTQAGRFNKTISVGEAAPIWKELPGVDGKLHSLAGLAQSKAVAVVFHCNSCPMSTAYQDRLIALQREYREAGLQVVAINLGQQDSESLATMKQRAESKGYNFPYLRDASQTVGRAYGASVTPHVFLLDPQRKIAYMGAVDNHQQESQVTKHYLRDAINAVLAGKQPSVAETRQVGCTIQYK